MFLLTLSNLTNFQPADFKALTHIFNIPATFRSNLSKTPIKRWISVCSILEQTATSCSSTLYIVQLLMFSGQDCFEDDDDRPRPLSPILLGSMLLTLPNLVKFQPADFKALTHIFSIPATFRSNLSKTPHKMLNHKLFPFWKHICLHTVCKKSLHTATSCSSTLYMV